MFIFSVWIQKGPLTFSERKNHVLNLAHDLVVPEVFCCVRFPLKNTNRYYSRIVSNYTQKVHDRDVEPTFKL